MNWRGRLTLGLAAIVAHEDMRPHGMAHTRTRNAGEQVIHTGGDFDSHVLVPVV
jgi:hypothetical protein